MTVHFDRPKFDRPLYLRSELSRIRKVPGEAPLSRLFAFSPEIFPQYQHDSLSTLKAAKISINLVKFGGNSGEIRLKFG